MDKLYRVLVSAGILLSLACIGSSLRCERESLFGLTDYFNCPQPGDDSDKIYCCGDDYKYCCSLNPRQFLESIFDDDDVEIHEAIKNVIPVIIGVVITVLVLVVCLICCCCCCPFCLLYKRKHRGTVHNPNPEVSVMQPLQNQPQQQPYYPPPQQAPYPTQAPPAGYPPQPYPPQPYPTDMPPKYTEKQPPPYNPTY